MSDSDALSESRACIFCDPPLERVVAEHGPVYVLEDGYAVSPGHSLVIPRRHIATLWEADQGEQDAIWAALRARREVLDRTLQPAPDGYNVGINIGAAAGQTVFHLHVHLIPRYDGDVPDPTGGVRGVIPDKANYRDPRKAPLSTGAPDDAFQGHLLPLFDGALEIDVLAAFVRDSGLKVLDGRIQGALRRGAVVRVLTGDYLEITQADALTRLLDWTRAAEALSGEGEGAVGSFEARVVEQAALRATSFHPKAWRFGGAGFETAFVGSSNVSKAALIDGVEWNLRVDRARDPRAYGEVSRGFEALWAQATVLTAEWVEDYRLRARAQGQAPPPGEAESEEREAPPEPRDIQAEALATLAETREDARRRALVVMATGLGKTWLAAFDVAAMAAERGVSELRVLVLAHRAELLGQAVATFRRIFPDASFGWFVGGRDEFDQSMVFASVQKLSRPEHLARLGERRFDYVVVDEAHHTAADSYRRILAHVGDAFVLGLTATPDRADEADILGLFDDHEAYRCDLGEGIRRGELSPFAYQGLKDTTDYAPIPWRNGRFEAAALESAVQTQARMERMWAAWEATPGERTLVFCCSIPHCGFVARWLGERGVRVAALHSGEGSDPRESSLKALGDGELDAVCAVDLLNEGVDVPRVDRVIMLRPTESAVIFLQQLGRGLRKVAGKAQLQVIDFVGNHRVFLERVRTLLSLGSSTVGIRDYLDGAKSPELPAGCSVDIELEAIELMKRLLPRDDRNALIRAYRERRATHGERPVAGEMARLGYSVRSLKHHKRWLGFVGAEGDLSEAERAAVEVGGAWFEDLERTAMTRCFKAVVLQVLLDADALWEGLAVGTLAERAHALVARSPELVGDIEGAKALGPDPRRPTPEARLAYWRQNPIKAWTGEGAGRRAWFVVEEGRFRYRAAPPADPEARAAFERLTRELVDLRLVQYRRRTRQAAAAEGGAFEAKLIHNKRHPIIKLPSRTKHTNIPEGSTTVRLPDGTAWDFGFAKIAINTARPPAAQRNMLPDLLRRFFGPSAGLPGTAFHVRFSPTPDGWTVEPVGAAVVPLPLSGFVRAFPTLRAAAGHLGESQTGDVEAEEVRLPGDYDPERCFAIRVSGDSMDGGAEPIRHGDWLVMQWARGLPAKAVEGRVALVSMRDGDEGQTYHLKRPKRRDGRWWLDSDNPQVAPIPGDASMEVVATRVATVSPEAVPLHRGDRLSDDELAERLGLSAPPDPPFSRVDGHLFLMIDEPGVLTAPDRIRPGLGNPTPAETAWLLTRTTANDPWTYQGVARERDGDWLAPAVDFDTWRALGHGRGASRTLPEARLDEAAALIQRLLTTLGKGSTHNLPPGRCRLVGTSARGGLRIDGGDGGFKERTVSPLDIAWALIARDTAEKDGAVLDEALVNRLRYLDGTPKESTRWIDSKWALALVGLDAPTADSD